VGHHRQHRKLWLAHRAIAIGHLGD
jgi:hypothetical protein